MFKAQANPFDDVVAKATDENLTSENWEFIMEAVDRVDSSGDTGARDVVAALIKRLAHRNAQVQIYTLETANALSQNCGVKVHRELSSRAFTDALLRLAGDRSTHQTVKARILERMEDWAEMYSKDPELGIMEQAYIKLKSQNPSLHAPSKPTKNAITDVDRQKEDEDLARALEISLQDTRANNNFAPSSSNVGTSVAARTAPESKPEPAPPTNNTAATVSRVRALYDFVPTEAGELAFSKGEVIAVLESVYKDWWKGSLRGQIGIFPLNYVEKLADPTPDELVREAQTEAEVFGQIKNVERLLSMLSTSSGEQNVQDNEEITTLYHQTLQIRPKLIDLISKYQQKRDDFSALNEKFVKARRDYEALLDTSMSQPPAPHYPQPYNHPPSFTGGQAPPPQNYPYPSGAPPQGYAPNAPFSPPENTNSGPYPGATGPVRTSAQPAQPFQTPYPTGAAPGVLPQGNLGPSSPGRQRISSYADNQPQELASSPQESRHDNDPQAQLPYKSYYTYQPPTGPPDGQVPQPQQQPPQAPSQHQQHQQQQPQAAPYPYLNNRPPSWHDPAGVPSAPPGGGGNPNDFYRNTGELFLPPGSRAT